MTNSQPDVVVNNSSAVISPSTARSIVYYPADSHLAVVESGSRTFFLYGISPLDNRNAAAYAQSAGFLSFANKISQYSATIECDDASHGVYKCFLMPERQNERFDVSKFAISLGAARASSDAPYEYKQIEAKAHASRKGNWAGM